MQASNAELCFFLCGQFILQKKRWLLCKRHNEPYLKLTNMVNGRNFALLGPGLIFAG